MLTMAADLTGNAPNQTSASLAGTTHHLPLTTPYYTATIPIWLDLISSPSEWASCFLSEEAREVLAVIGGMVLVFALPNPSSAAADEAEDPIRSLVRQFGKVVKQGLGGWDWDGVGLAVGVGEGETEAWDELCAEAGLEFVQLTGQEQGRNEFGGTFPIQSFSGRLALLGAAPVPYSLTAVGGTEKMGVARVREALESNEWEQLRPSALADVDATLDYDDDAPHSNESDREFDVENLGFGFDRADFEGLRRAIWSGNGQGPAEGIAAEDEHNTPMLAFKTNPEDGPARKPGKPREAGTENAPKQDFVDDEDENDGNEDEDVTKVEEMMRKLHAVREAGAGMGQEQRRRMAARAVEEVMREL